jgi:hypothetical protein
MLCRTESDEEEDDRKFAQRKQKMAANDSDDNNTSDAPQEHLQSEESSVVQPDTTIDPTKTYFEFKVSLIAMRQRLMVDVFVAWVRSLLLMCQFEI